MRILLVDDDSDIITALLPVLKMLSGHESRSATDGAEALKIAAEMGGVDLLITDVVMQPVDGFTLRDQFVTRYPNVRTVLITGYDLSDYPLQTQFHQVLQKPVTVDALSAAVEYEEKAIALGNESITVASDTMAIRPAQQRPAPVPSAPAPPEPSLRTGETVPVPLPRHFSAPAAPTTAPGRKADPALAETQPGLVAPGVRKTADPALSETQPGLTAPGVTRPATPAGAQARVALPSKIAPRPVPAPSGDEGAPTSSDNLIGQMLGAYQILSLLGESRWGTVYAAVQVSINRPVGLKVLDPARAKNAVDKARFIADARAKANVQHPAILSVYEAGESSGHIFYAHEFVDGRNLSEIASAGDKIDELTALRVLRATAEGLSYLGIHNIPHTPLAASKVYLSVDNQPRLSNLASQLPDHETPTEMEIQTLGFAIRSVVSEDASEGLRSLLERMHGGPGGVGSWGGLLQGVKALEPKIVPVEAAKISAQDRAAVAAVEAARKQQKRTLMINVASMGILLAFGIFALWYSILKNRQTVGEEQVVIPAGAYIVRNGEKVQLEEFSIDKYEVTVAQYANFVDYLEKHPQADNDFNHPRQPRHLSHRPPNWDIFYLRAKAKKPVHSAPYSLDHPVVEITWWDAYAYAKWRGRELPTEQQWEAAARGAEGLPYPWGKDFDPKKVNSNADYDAANPGALGKVDGHNFWSAVNAIMADKSPLGVIGMAGNVSEWTASWTPDNRFPVVKGGSYLSPDVKLDRRVIDQDPSHGEEHIGFRTISKTPIKK